MSRQNEQGSASSVESNVLAVSNLEARQRRERGPAERISEAVAQFAGSMLFVYLHIIWFGVWIFANTAFKGFDPFPFTFLTLVVSLEAIFLSTFILISQNNEAKLTERRNHLDLQVNMLAEQENTKILELLEKIATKVGIDCDDAGLRELLAPVEADEILRTIVKAAETPVDNPDPVPASPSGNISALPIRRT